MIAQGVSGKGLRGALFVLTVCVALPWLTDRDTTRSDAMCACGVAVAERSRDDTERRWYGHCFVRLISHVQYRGHDEACFCCQCCIVTSRQSSSVARWTLLMRRAWLGWCVACVFVSITKPCGRGYVQQLTSACI